ncbi:virulence factor TspB C-terminal domain-related protein [Acinetobacter colistiniresistens]|uniref:virulence factor TspB C-terminal domain-related protein n=3 Tax=Acinetobacter colistiniresistens TaxID=280145 RepID=UPI00125067A7|nr:virulence factor TspB C-terminal domain-related protein [Acinetobacter colistiniresistens]
MRFFSYLLLIFASIISVNAFAAEKVDWWIIHGKTGFFTKAEVWNNCLNDSLKYGVTGTKCFDDGTSIRINKGTNGGVSPYGMYDHTEEKKCPAKGSLKVFYYPAGSTSVPTRTCVDGCTYEGGHAIDTPNHVAITMQATGDSSNCTNQSGPKQPPQCDKTDPYGGCYVPPNDDCIRLKDGSIQCPDNSKPPQNNTCNGADYCKRPPEGCGSGYVPGSFNGQQLCVRSGPNVPKKPPEPDNPQDPNNCMNGGTYCPQPPDNTQCPSGYSETTYNGSKICVKNNPDPKKPNPNDPNNPDYGGGDNGGGDGSTGGGTIDVKGIIDAINALKAALLNAIAGISGKLDTLIAGQKTGNEHLKNIKDESVKTNEKLDKSNEHLDKIKDATSAASDTLGDINDAAHATSEAVGETNKKLDSIKDAIDSQSKCLDKNSGKYRECTSDDFSAASIPDGKVDILEREIDTNFDGNIISVSDQCPPPMVIRFNLLEEHVITFSYDNFCYGASLARPWVIFVGMFTAFLIVTGQIRGGSDD